MVGAFAESRAEQAAFVGPQLTPENWSESKTTRRMGRISMSAMIEDAGEGRYRGVYGDPNGFGTEVFFDSLEEALAWANTDGSAVFLTVT